MGQQFRSRANAQVRMQDTSVADEHAWRTDLALREILVPRGKHPNGEGGGQMVEMAPHSGLCNAECASELRCIPELGMVVREHRPEASHGLGRHAQSHLGKVSLQEVANEGAPPTRADLLRPSKERLWESTAQPQALPASSGHFFEIESGEFHVPDSPRQGLRALFQQFWRSTPQNQEPRGKRTPIREHTQNGKKIGTPLDLIDHHQSPQ